MLLADQREDGLDSGLMFAWFPRMLGMALVVAFIVRLFIRRGAVAFTVGAVLPLLYDVVKAFWSVKTAIPKDFWCWDLPLLCGIGLCATVPGPLLGIWLGKWSRRSAYVR